MNSQNMDTRTEILDYLFKHSPALVTDICKHFGLTAPGVRRHIDNLLEAGLIEEVEEENISRGRGRPAKRYRLSNKGRDSYGHNYDDLATLALREVAHLGGEEALRAFAKKRIHSILGDIENTDTEDIHKAAKNLVHVLNKNGYSGEVRVQDDCVQICQYHCPIKEVAAEFPQLCAAEHQAMSEALNRTLQIESSIIDGRSMCLTTIPLHPKKDS